MEDGYLDEVETIDMQIGKLKISNGIVSLIALESLVLTAINTNTMINSTSPIGVIGGAGLVLYCLYLTGQILDKKDDIKSEKKGLIKRRNSLLNNFNKKNS